MQQHHEPWTWLLLFGAIGACGTIGACGEGSSSQNNTVCPAGYEQSGPACIPVFDDCDGEAEISVLGGGCQTVGVTTCATGLFESDGEGGCEPILPDYSCGPGTIALLGQTECHPVGVTECAAGFESDGEDGCNAILPPGPAPCPYGTIALLGHATCQPLGDCGSDTWGNIVDDGITVYVDQTADATGADGTQQTPFLTIGEALAAAQPGGQIAIAAGDYVERLTINQAVRLTGRCPALVTIRGRFYLGDPKSPVTINSGGSGTSIRGVTLTGPAQGLVIDGAQQVVVEQVQVRDASEFGIVVAYGAEAIIQRVSVARCVEIGIYLLGGTLAVEQSVVRDTQPEPGTGWVGRGISAHCASAGVCGSLRVSSSLISGNRELGIFANGVDAEVTATVVRDTLPEENSGMGGAGLHAQCPTPEDCGGLRVESCLFTGNREVGISVSGVEAEVISTVVRDTQSEESIVAPATGINAECYSPGLCGSLRVYSSVLSGNRGVGITARGLPTEVHSTVVRDTLAVQSSEVLERLLGGGIYAGCSDYGDSCASLLVSASLVSGNREIGILADGVETEVNTTVVSGTLSEEATGKAGRGISAQCDSSGICGRLLVSACLVSDNRSGGVWAVGVDAEVNATVVRDTLSEELTGWFGWGIGAECEADNERCGTLLVSSCLVSGSREVGIAASGVDAEIHSTVVRNTLTGESMDLVSRGIGTYCSPAGTCGSLRVSSSLVSGNHGLGIAANGVDIEINATVVRDTLPDQATQRFGRGIAAECATVARTCGRLKVSSSLVLRSREVGIDSSGVEAEIISTVVRDTLPNESTGSFGRGIGAQCYTEVGACGNLQISSCLVIGSEDIGIFIAGRQATLEGVAVIDTVSNAQGMFQGTQGQGIWSLCDERVGECGQLSMTSCLVESSQSSGVAVEGVSGFVRSSVVRSVTSQPLDNKYGYGVQIGGLEGGEMPMISVLDCEIRDAKLAGILFYRAGGTVGRSVVTGGENSVVMNQGSAVTILDNNDLTGTVTDEPIWADLYPSPSPPPLLSTDSTQ